MGEIWEQVNDKIRVIKPWKYRVYKKFSTKKDLINIEVNRYSDNFNGPDNEKSYGLFDSWEISLGEVHLVSVYSGMTDTLAS